MPIEVMHLELSKLGGVMGGVEGAGVDVVVALLRVVGHEGQEEAAQGALREARVPGTV